MNERPFLDTQRIAILENNAHLYPRLTELKTLLVAAAGYSGLLLVLALGCLLAKTGLQDGRLMLLAGGLGLGLGGSYLMLSCLMQADGRPEGRSLQPAEALALFRMLSKLQRQLKVAPLDAVLVDERFAVELVEVARFGLLGGVRRYLVVGLPMLLALSSSELGALVVEEYGRLHGGRPGWRGWLYRMRRRWGAWYPALQEDTGTLAGWVQRFYLWYIPRFLMHTLALARRQERAATQLAAQVIGAQATATAAVKTRLFGRFFDDHYWQNYWRFADSQTSPPFGPYAGLHEGFQQGERLWRSSRWFKEVLAEQPPHDDPRPSLKEKLDLLVQVARPAAWPAQSAGEKWLGVTLGKLVAEFDREWLAINNQNWKARYRAVQQEDTELAMLRMQSPDSLDDLQLWRLAQLSHARVGATQARPLLERVLTRDPQHAQARYLLASLLLDAGDERGLGCMEQAMKLDQQLVDEGLLHCQRYLQRHSRLQDFEALWSRLASHHRRASMA
ncbi:hypothetical protein N8I74_14995 [Chitiniphilus purpureus]|uniref:Peptidase M48 domain-containing protein n=1 Tax=Chitiniphilus purpureus TaxID=2981137 RepID=A0ABY6DNC6_9NEIS|nr:hypothetical protein [Chitiniphilus sp. CD1]UXY14616.1 hypothetical protein N8I74_14995 [Chitiniphilus sp. CD1]